MVNTPRQPFRIRAIGAGLRAIGASGLPKLVAPIARGAGAILMFHHVRPGDPQEFAPNRGLEITPEFLGETLAALADNGFDLIGLDEALARLRRPQARPFAVLTFDDGYRDTLAHALPVLERHAAPFTVYVTSGFADGSARLWWIELEQAIRNSPEVVFAGERMATATVAQKMAIFARLYWSLRSGDEARLLEGTGLLARQAGLEMSRLTRDLCMGWDDIARLAAHPLCTIGVHTITHPRLAWLPAKDARRELAGSRTAIENAIGKPAVHLAYPVGDPTSAGAREFALAADLGFETAVTTRKGMIFPGHAEKATALPRLSVNGCYQDRAMLDLLLTGAPFLLWNRGRRVAA